MTASQPRPSNSSHGQSGHKCAGTMTRRPTSREKPVSGLWVLPAALSLGSFVRDVMVTDVVEATCPRLVEHACRVILSPKVKGDAA